MNDVLGILAMRHFGGKGGFELMPWALDVAFWIRWSEWRKLNWNTEHESAWAARRVQAQDIWAQ